MHGLEPQHHWLRETLSIWFWGVALPLCTVCVAFIEGRLAWLMLAAYLALLLRIYFRSQWRGRSRANSLLYAAACVLGKFPQALGQIRFYMTKLLGQRHRRIDYKSA